MTTIPETTLLAALDGVEYLLLTSPAVLAVRNDLVAYYCGGGEWDASPAAQEATRRTRIAALETELAQLRAAGPLLPAPATGDEPRAACPHCGERFKQRGMNRHLSKCPKRPARLAAAPVEPAMRPEPEPPAIAEVRQALEASFAPPEPEPAPADELYGCPQCEREFTTRRGLDGHIGRVHVALARKAEPPVVEGAAPAAPKPAPRFRCDACGRADFKSAHALTVHVAMAHKSTEVVAAPPPAPWACATCGKAEPDAEQALTDRKRCKACVRAANGGGASASAALAATVARPKATALP